MNVKIIWKNKPFCENCDLHFNIPYLFCPKCNNLVKISPIKGPNSSEINEISIWSFHQFLPSFNNIISLNEGFTPVLEIANIVDLKGMKIKLEFRNPTGTFRDRASSLIISDALERKTKKIVNSSTGSFSISLAAYATRGKISSTCVVPIKTELSKIEQMIIYNSTIIKKGKKIEETTKIAEEIAHKEDSYFPMPNKNILTIQGQKTIGLEIALQNTKIESLIVPRGSGSLILSIYYGLLDALESGWIKKLPMIFAVSISERHKYHLVEGLDVKEERLFDEVTKIINQTHGRKLEITGDQMIKDAILFAQKEGLFIEPASASVISAAKILIEEKSIVPNSTLAILTGSGHNAMNIFASHMRKIKKVVWGLSGFSTKRFEILNIIDEKKANHGYQIWNVLGKKKTLQSIYQHLSRLVDDKLIEDEIPEKRKAHYRLTEEGKRRLNEMHQYFDN